MDMEVRRVDVETTLPLRRQVLRPHQTLDELRLAGDDDPDTGHFAAVDGEGVVRGTASVRREAPPWAPEQRDAWRLRGMATAEGYRSRGVGAAVLDAVIDHVAGRGGGLLWCSARLPAVEFYRRAGFETTGEEWEEPIIGPHIAMVKTV